MSTKKHIAEMAKSLARTAPYMSNHKANDVEALLVDASNLLEGPRTFNAAYLYKGMSENRRRTSRRNRRRTSRR